MTERTRAGLARVPDQPAAPRRRHRRCERDRPRAEARSSRSTARSRAPVLQRPLELGADLVVHSSTKFLGGHSDVLGGAVLTSDDLLEERLRFHQNAVGAVPSPFDCWLLLRGLKTLQLRVHRQSDNALAVARWLEGQDAVVRVHYPGLASNPRPRARAPPDGRAFRRRGVLRSVVRRRRALVPGTAARLHARRITRGGRIARRRARR